MAKTYVEPGRAALTGAFVSRKGAASYGEFYSDRRPDADDDETQGFAEGSIWHYVDRQRVYICVDPTPEAAVWRDLRDAAKVTIICRNNTGSTITKGSIVYVTGATGNRPTIALADKDSQNTSSRTLGMVVSDIANGADGSVAVNGTVDDLNTAAFVAGTPLWLGDNGALTATVPTPPAHSVFIGWVAVSSANNGRIILHIQNGYELEELHDVLITTPLNQDIIYYDGNASPPLWKNRRAYRNLGRFISDDPVSDDSVIVMSHTLAAGLLSTNGDIVCGEYAGTCSGFVEDEQGARFGIAIGGDIYGAIPAGTVANGDWNIRFTLIRDSSTTHKITTVATYTSASGLTTVTDYGASDGGIDWTGTEVIGLHLSSSEFTTIVARIGWLDFQPKP